MQSDEQSLTAREKQEKAAKLAQHIWKLSHDRLLVNLRFLDVALADISFEAAPHTKTIACRQDTICYDPVTVLQRYQEEPAQMTRTLLHILLHLIFHHAYHYEKVEQRLWDIAADMAVEYAILGLEIPSLLLEADQEQRKVFAAFGERIPAMTAERIYRYLKEQEISQEQQRELWRIFQKDDHTPWQQQEQLEMTLEQWKRISERVKAQLKSFSTEQTDPNRRIEQNLEEATREHYDYSDFLRRFCVSGEDIQTNDDEFDYIYYTYGLSLYGNLPLVEPLEYKDVHKIREFVIAIDTSASCRGKLVQAFLQKTYDILKNSESFFRKVNIHILQCDSQVRSDTKITSDEEFEVFMKTGKLEGFGSTDFRPVFRYVEQMLEQGMFENLKGLLYFTDGFGIFPEQMPPYDTAFIFLEDDYQQPQIPPWAIKLVLSEEDLETP